MEYEKGHLIMEVFFSYIQKVIKKILEIVDKKMI